MAGERRGRPRTGLRGLGRMMLVLVPVQWGLGTDRQSLRLILWLCRSDCGPGLQRDQLSQHCRRYQRSFLYFREGAVRMPAMMRKPSVPTKQKFPKNGKNVELKPSTAEEQTGPIYSMENLDKLHFFILVVLPLIGIQGVIRHFSVIVWQSWALALFMYAFGALGITMVSSIARPRTESIT